MSGGSDGFYRYYTIPRQPLFGIETEREEAYFLAFGVPYDLTSSFRPGSRYGPETIRKFTANIEVNSYFRDFDVVSARVHDLGDIAFDYRPSEMLKRVYRTVVKISGEGKIPVMLGGEHTFTLASVTALREKNPVLVVFDAHLDLRDEYLGLRINHATYLRRLAERMPRLEVYVLGVRGYDREEIRYGMERGVKIFLYHNFMEGVKTLAEAVAGKNIYISLDIDVLDPSIAPGVGNPEAGGAGLIDVARAIHMLSAGKIVGLDLVEVSPLYDTGATAAAASRLLVEMLAAAVKE